jgi:hypothetical protein
MRIKFDRKNPGMMQFYGKKIKKTITNKINSN